MDWVQDMTSRWIRIMGAASSGGGTPLDEAVRQITAITDAPAKTGGGLGWRRRKPVAEDASAVTVLSRQLIAGVLVSDLAIARLAAAEGLSREQVLARLADDPPAELRDQQLRALQAELSGGVAALRDSARASYSGLGQRIEQLLRLAEQQSAELIEQARLEAARITEAASAAGSPSSAPDSTRDDSAESHPGSVR